ncbi:hypothetical protein KP509_31G053200 [Ceratopteris richardii]|nr:hypothetical protein KP509_31G053200 [Ceratopteris richardii]
MSEEFGTPLTSPTHFSEAKGKELEASHSSSWLSWTRGSKDQNASTSSVQHDYVEDMDPFVIPSDYTWIDMKEKKRRLKARKSKTRSRKPSSKQPESASKTDAGECCLPAKLIMIAAKQMNSCSRNNTFKKMQMK